MTPVMNDMIKIQPQTFWLVGAGLGQAGGPGAAAARGAAPAEQPLEEVAGEQVEGCPAAAGSGGWGGLDGR